MAVIHVEVDNDEFAKLVVDTLNQAQSDNVFEFPLSISVDHDPREDD
tara:strand:+ start:322 stop:462 length:141 start_codon:yes stop_codon:yes gene_type:complete